MQLNFIQTVLAGTLSLWIIALGVSLLFKKQKSYWDWTVDTLKAIWDAAWQFIIGLAIGYFLAVEHFFRLSFH